MSTLPVYNGLTSTSSNASTIVWGGNTTNNTTGGISYPGPYIIGSGPYYTTRVAVDIKRCRSCNHAHLAEQPGCVDTNGYDVVFQSICSCKEYLPKDNLEYLEYLDKKKTSK